jgi:WD40 repeat protein
VQVELWAGALRRARRVSGPRRAGAVAPYRGLASFQPEDAAWFFGREDLTGHLAGLAGAAHGPLGESEAALPLMVVGPSGSGKSSLLRAGLIPALCGDALPAQEGDEGSWLLFSPGQAPMAALGVQLPAAAREQEDKPSREASEGGSRGVTTGPVPRLVVVDQFEEVFAACPDEEERVAFIGALSALCGQAVVVLGMRADFYGRALRYPVLASALQHRQVVVGPMTQDQLRRAIVEPARLAKTDVDPGLVELMLQDLLPPRSAQGGSPPGHEPGALPLLSHALLATWERSRGGKLTVADYQASGGIRGAVTRTAEEVYQSLGDGGREEACRLFLQLVQVTDDGMETRCRVPVSDLLAAPGHDAPAGDVLSGFVSQRLITIGENAAEISHEALLHAWPRLRAWIDEDRDGLRIRRRTDESARHWEEASRDEAALLRGGQLDVTAEWAAHPRNLWSLTTLARDFIAAGVAREQAEKDAERRRSRRLRRLAATLAVLLLATVALSGYSLVQRQAAITARDNADSRDLASEASQLRDQDVSVAAQLSLAAYRAAPTPEAVSALLDSTAGPAAARLIDSTEVVESVALSPDHRVLAVTADDGTLRLWDVTAPGRPAPLGPPLIHKTRNPLYTVAFSPDGHRIDAAGADQVIHLWTISDPRHPVAASSLNEPTSTVYSVIFSPDGRLLAAASADGTVFLWNAAATARPRLLARLAAPGGSVQSVAFSTDGNMLAAGSTDATVRLWSVTNPARPVPLGKPLTGPSKIVSSVAFSPDDSTLTAGSHDHKLWLWKITDPSSPDRLQPLPVDAGWVTSVAFSPDGTTVAAGTSASRIYQWDLASRRRTAVLPQAGTITSLAWRDPRLLIAAASDGAVHLWTLPSPVLDTDGGANSVAFGPDGKMLAVGSQDLELWNPAARTRLSTAPVPGAFANAVALGPNGILAAGYGNGTVQLWRTTHGTLTPFGRPLGATASGASVPHDVDPVESVAFSRNGQLLASGVDDGTVRLWNISDPVRPGQAATIPDAGTMVFGVAFNPDDHILAAASADNLTRLWDITTPATPRLLGKPLKGPASYAMSAAFSPDGKTVAVGSADRSVRLWNITRPATPAPIGSPLTGPEAYAYSVAFSPDGRSLAAGVTDHTVRLWSMTSISHPALMATLTSPTGAVFSVAFSPDGQTLAAASGEGTIRLWDTTPQAAAHAVCATAGQPLTPAEWARYAPGRPYAPPCPSQDP